MMDDNFKYQALAARDVRFDGLFFVGVTSTGIYCRPICTARTPKKSNCRFFSHAASAEKEHFRPCLRCRPELAPGHSPLEAGQQMAYRLAQAIQESPLNKELPLAELAQQLNLSPRHLRRISVKEFGVSPIQLAQTQRLLLAKQLLTGTNLSITEIAFASGFSSVRRFNTLLKAHYRLTPSQLRKATALPSSDGFSLPLAYRPPLAWPQLLGFLGKRAVTGVEIVTSTSYARTLQLGQHQGWVKASQSSKGHYLTIELSLSLLPVLSKVLDQVRHFFDLCARPDIIHQHLGQDPLLSRLIQKHPGLRVPGTMNVFELSWRAVLGQQISVKAATTMAGRLAERFGTPLLTPDPTLNRLSPMPETIAGLDPTALQQLGIQSSKALTIIKLGQLWPELQHDLNGEDHSHFLKLLLSIKGIGLWTAQYIAMRALGWPDAFMPTDLVLCQVTEKTTKNLETTAEAWRPWRAYAAMYLWQSAPSPTIRKKP